MADKKIALNEEMLNKLPKGVFSDLIGAFGEQVGEAKLDKETRDALKEKLGVDEDTAKVIHSHMWPLNLTRLPASKEAWIVCIADKCCSLHETLFRRKSKK